MSYSLGLLLLQVGVIIFAAKIFGALARRIGQPVVIGEIFAGIVLGPSLLGWALPGISTWLFPKDGLVYLNLLSQIGLLLFMFIVGMEVDIQHLKHQTRAAAVISPVSILVPCLLGMLLSIELFDTFAPTNTHFLLFALFMGVAMSITAFPVLARIVQERGLVGTPLGNIAIACAAIDDVTAWCLLAVVVAIAKSADLVNTMWMIAFATVFAGIMALVVRPLLMHAHARGGIHVTWILLVILLSSAATEMIGIHALFGAFVAGLVMPASAAFRMKLKEKTETIGSFLLLPIFFAIVGLRTRIDLLNSSALWLTCAGIIAVAVAGKLGAAACAARCVGMQWKEALAVGALMNTRGLVELVVLTVGYDLGVIADKVFALMVIMALVTTCMAGPLLNALGYFAPKRIT